MGFSAAFIMLCLRGLESSGGFLVLFTCAALSLIPGLAQSRCCVNAPWRNEWTSFNLPVTSSVSERAVDSDQPLSQLSPGWSSLSFCGKPSPFLLSPCFLILPNSLGNVHHLPLERPISADLDIYRDLFVEKATDPTPVLLPGKSHQQRNLAGFSPWGC